MKYTKLYQKCNNEALLLLVQDLKKRLGDYVSNLDNTLEDDYAVEQRDKINTIFEILASRYKSKV